MKLHPMPVKKLISHHRCKTTLEWFGVYMGSRGLEAPIMLWIGIFLALIILDYLFTDD
jgi:hypothetical protein